MVLKPQDVLVALKAALLEPGSRFVFADIAKSLGLSRSEVHAAVQRCVHSKLMMRVSHRVDAAAAPNRTNLLEFLLHGVRYAFPPTYGSITRGMPTGYAAPILSNYFAPTASLPPIWPTPTGHLRGRAFEPLYPSVPLAASNDEELYSALALVDAIRGGSARDREIAEPLLKEMLARPRGTSERESRHA